jgi:beta-1,4-mannosyltransferase
VDELGGLLGGRNKSSEERLAAAKNLVNTLIQHRIALVQTLHGPRPDAHEEWCTTVDEATSAFIVLDETTQTPDHQRTTLIPHAHYREWFQGYPRAEQVPGRLLNLSRGWLGATAESLLKIFSLTDTPGLSLRVVGEADATLHDLAARAIARSPHAVSTILERISDGAAVMEITAAEIVVLPAVVSIDDLSLLFMALSLDRPVVVEEGATVRRLNDEVGPGWIFQHQGPLTAELLDETVATVRRTSREDSPRFDGREWNSTAAKYAEVFRGAAAAAASKSQQSEVVQLRSSQEPVHQLHKNALAMASVAGIAFLVGRFAGPGRNRGTRRLRRVVPDPALDRP